MADHHGAGVDSGTHRNLTAFWQSTIYRLNGLDDSKAGAHGTLGIIAMRSRPSEICDDSVTLILRNITVEARNHAGYGLMIGLNYLMIFLGVEADGELRRADQVGKQDGQMTPLAGRLEFRRRTDFAERGIRGFNARAAIAAELFIRSDRVGARSA
jgi:hypothetical protein